MSLVGQHVDDGHQTLAGHPLHRGVGENPGADAAVVAGQSPSDVLDGLPDVHSHLASLDVHRMSAQLEDSHLHGIAGPGRRLLENQRHALALQYTGRRQVGGQVQDPV